MSVYPGAVFKPTTWGGQTPRRKGQRGILHVAVSGARSLPPWNGNTWHFYVAADGYCEQYVDTEFIAWASVDANADAISIETQGGLGTAAQVNAEPWTAAQASRIADIMRWANKLEGIPLTLLPDSMAGRRGWGPHRLGISPWRVSGGQVWSNSNGKLCPGDAKIAQIPSILKLAQGADMPLTDADFGEITHRVLDTDLGGGSLSDFVRSYRKNPPNPTVDPAALAAALLANPAAVAALGDAIAAGLAKRVGNG